jgi:hypothetical protein
MSADHPREPPAFGPAVRSNRSRVLAGAFTMRFQRLESKRSWVMRLLARFIIAVCRALNRVGIEFYHAQEQASGAIRNASPLFPLLKRAER